MAILVGVALSLTANTARSNEICSQASYAYVKETLQCNLELISWVDVILQGELLRKHKTDYERLIRLRLRNDLSMIKHETLGYVDALSKNDFNTDSPEMRKRGNVQCIVWTVGEDYPVAEFVECELQGYGEYFLRSDFSSRMLGYSDSSNANEQVRSMIREIMTDISAEFLEARDNANQ